MIEGLCKESIDLSLPGERSAMISEEFLDLRPAIGNKEILC